MKKVLITPRSFGKYNREELIEKLLQHGIEPVFNPYGTIMNEQQMRSALQDMDGLIVGVDPVSEEALRQAPRLRAIAKYGVGIDNIACAYAQENDIAISRTVNANANAVADYAMTLLMSVARRVVEIDYFFLYQIQAII
jgi:phosphoglycerate dehydrogenase-like enzyme